MCRCISFSIYRPQNCFRYEYTIYNRCFDFSDQYTYYSYPDDYINRELQNTYPDIDLNQEIDDYCYENKLESAYTLDVIEHNLTLRKLFESVVDNLLNKYNLADTYNINTRIKTIFNEAS